jgi:hypothetical protein
MCGYMTTGRDFASNRKSCHPLVQLWTAIAAIMPFSLAASNWVPAIRRAVRQDYSKQKQYGDAVLSIPVNKRLTR